MNWFVALTSTSKEVEVADALNAAGCEAYCPMRVEQRRPRNMKLPKGRFVEVSSPLFSRYIFWRGDWDVAMRVRHLRGVLRCGDFVAKVRDVEIEKIRQLEASGIFDAITEELFITSGDRVQVKEGILEGKRGVFVGSINAINSEVDILASRGRIRVSLPTAMLEKLGGKRS